MGKFSFAVAHKNGRVDAARFAGAYDFDLDKTLYEYHGFQGPLHIGKPIQPMIDVSAKFGMIAKPFKAEDMMSSVLAKPPTSR